MGRPEADTYTTRLQLLSQQVVNSSVCQVLFRRIVIQLLHVQVSRRILQIRKAGTEERENLTRLAKVQVNG